MGIINNNSKFFSRRIQVCKSLKLLSIYKQFVIRDFYIILKLGNKYLQEFEVNNYQNGVKGGKMHKKF